MDQGLTDLTVKLLPKAGQGCGLGLRGFWLAFLFWGVQGGGEAEGGLEDLQVRVEEDLGLRLHDVGLLVEEAWGLALKI